jgi:hypothetical protein
MNKKKILISTNLTQNAEYTIWYGLQLGKWINAKVIIAYISEFTGNMVDMDHTNYAMPSELINLNHEELKKATRESYTKTITKFKQKNEQLPETEFYFKSGNEPIVLAEMIKKMNIRLILNNRKDDEKFFEKYISDNNFRIAESVPCPVLIIPPEYDFIPVQKIIYATDYKKEDINTLKQLSKFAQYFNAHIHALHVCENLAFEKQVKKIGFEEKVQKQVGYNHIEHKVTQGKDVALNVNEFASRIHAGMISILNTNHNFLEKIFSKPTSKELMWKTNIPIMIFSKD